MRQTHILIYDILQVMANTKIEITADSDLISQSQSLYDQLGMTLEEAFRIFLRQSILKNGLPLTVTLSAKQEQKSEITLIPTVEKLISEVIPETKDTQIQTKEEQTASLPSGTVVAYDEEEDTDLTCPSRMFDSWDTGDEEEIGCR